MSSPPEIRGPHHVAIVTRDLPASERFYVEVLGLTRGARHHRPDGTHRATWVHLPDGSFLALEIAGEGPGRADTAPGLHCLALSIAPSDREAWRARLQGAGHPVERETAFTLYLRDPDGVLVGLSHHPAVGQTPPSHRPQSHSGVHGIDPVRIGGCPGWRLFVSLSGTARGPTEKRTCRRIERPFFSPQHSLPSARCSWGVAP